MHEIHIANIRGHDNAQIRGFRVDRMTPLGNRFKLTLDTEDERARLIGEYRRWLWSKIYNRDEAVMEALRELVIAANEAPIALLCWCAPKACHASVVKTAVRYLQRETAQLEVITGPGPDARRENREVR